jgi:hypothetical protein
MAIENLAERFSNLEKTIERQQREIERFQAIHEIQNLVSKYDYFHTANQHTKIAELFAKKTPGVAAHLELWGNWEGNEGIQRMFGKGGLYDFRDHQEKRGTLVVHTNTTPVIEVAGDGKTAKGVWISPGFATVRTPDGIKAAWGWYKYGVDFVKEDGEWKYWHFRLSPLIHAPYDKSWIEAPWSPPHLEKRPPEHKEDTPATEWYGWAPDVAPTNHPLPPEPYETFDEETAY